MKKLFICDAQVHAPNRPLDAAAGVDVGGIDRIDLEREMDMAGVSRTIIVPLGADQTERAMDYVRENPNRFAMMPVFPLTEEPNPKAVDLIGDLKRATEVVGMRVSFFREASRRLLVESDLDWLWDAAAQVGMPVMINAPENAHRVGEIASRHPKLRILLDHMGVTPRQRYSDFNEVLSPVLALSQFGNVGIKLTQLPRAAGESYPFPTLHEPIKRVVTAFGSHRVFWGSDLSVWSWPMPWAASTRSSNPYLDYVRLFTDVLPFLTDHDKEWIMGRAVCEWIGWPVPASVVGAD